MCAQLNLCLSQLEAATSGRSGNSRIKKSQTGFSRHLAADFGATATRRSKRRRWKTLYARRKKVVLRKILRPFFFKKQNIVGAKSDERCFFCFYCVASNKFASYCDLNFQLSFLRAGFFAKNFVREVFFVTFSSCWVLNLILY